MNPKKERFRGGKQPAAQPQPHSQPRQPGPRLLVSDRQVSSLPARLLHSQLREEGEAHPTRSAEATDSAGDTRPPRVCENEKFSSESLSFGYWP